MLRLAALLVLFAASLVIACSDSKDAPAPSSQPEPTESAIASATTPSAADVPVATPADCPMHQDVCDLAAEVDWPLRIFQENRPIDGSPDALAVEDLRGIVTILQTVAVPCRYSRLMSHSLCEGVPSAQSRLGIWMWNLTYGDARRGATVTEVQRDLLFRSPRQNETERDEFGPPELRVVAIGCPTTIADLSECREDFSLVLSSNATYPHDDAQRRHVVILPVFWPADGPPAVRLTIPVAPTTEAASAYAPFILGGIVSGDGAVYTQEPEWLSGEASPATGVFIPWRP
jgi:hypothetical protein